MRLPLAIVLLVCLAPAAAACNGLSPGDNIVSDGASCTLAFLVANEDGLYFATAGHCVDKVGSIVSNPDVGEIGATAFRHLDPDTGSASDGSPGEDFALIRIKPELYDKLNPAVCGWGGPTGLVTDDSADGGGVRHYGYGMVVGESEPTRKREGYNLINEGPNYAFYWSGAGVPGDSGSAVLAEDGRALGVLTHLLVRPPDTNGGTHLLRGFELAQAAGFAPLRLVLAGEDPRAVLAEMQGAQPGPADGEGGAEGKDPAPTPGNQTASTPGPSPTPATPAGNGTREDNVTPNQDGTNGGVPGATAGDGNETPGAPLALVLLAFVGVALRRRVQR